MGVRWISVAWVVCVLVGAVSAADGPAATTKPVGAKRNVYVCDASREMGEFRPALVAGIKDTIGRLLPSDAFNVILFNQAGVTIYSPELSAATPEIKAEVTTEGGWIDRKFELAEAGDPIAAIQAAFAQRPTTIFFSTCGLGQYKDPKIGEKLQARIRELNMEKAVQVHMILPERPAEGPTVAAQNAMEDARILKAIADDNRGRLRWAPLKTAKPPGKGGK